MNFPITRAMSIFVGLRTPFPPYGVSSFLIIERRQDKASAEGPLSSPGPSLRTYRSICEPGLPHIWSPSSAEVSCRESLSVAEFAPINSRFGIDGEDAASFPEYEDVSVVPTESSPTEKVENLSISSGVGSKIISSSPR